MGQFLVHNSLLSSDEQPSHSLVTLQRLTYDFQVVKSGSANGNMDGYYQVDGPGLPHGKKIAAALDSVIVFSIRKSGENTKAGDAE